MTRNLVIIPFTFVIVLLGCKQTTNSKEKSNSDDTSFRKRIINSSRRASGETDLANYKDYDFYLYYVDAGPWKESIFFSLRLKDNVLYSYSKYMNKLVSNQFPPLYYLENNNSIYYTVVYQEHKLDIKDILNNKLKSVGFYEENAFPPIDASHNLTSLFVYSKDLGPKSISNWDTSAKIGTVIKYIRDSIMKYNSKFINITPENP